MRSPGGLEKVVALKVLRDDIVLSPEAIARLRDEGRLLARINHPVVVRAFDLTAFGDRVGLVTEFVDGEDLESCLGSPARVPLRPLIQIVGQLASALDAAYRATSPDGQPLFIVHRDVKPTNVRIGRHAEVKLLDFGIARFQAVDRASHTQSDVVMGSIPYVSPERLAEHASLPAGDVFGLGCVLFEGVTGERFYRQGTLRVVSAICATPESFASHLESRLVLLDVSKDISEVVSRCLCFDPAARITARELAVRCEIIGDELAGPTLRRWCSERTFPEIPSEEGPLSNQILVEDIAEIPSPPLLLDLAPSPKPVAYSELPTIPAPPKGGDRTKLVERPPASQRLPPEERPRPKRAGSRTALFGLLSVGCLGVSVTALIVASLAASFALKAGWLHF